MNFVPENLNEAKKSKTKTLKIAAGLVIIQNGAVLLGHPTHRKWWGTYSIPKGEVKLGESLLHAAIRETYEEVGIKIDPQEIENNKPDYIEYTDKSGTPYKRVYYFIVLPKKNISLSSIKLRNKEEIDWAGFITPEKAEKRIYWRLKPILDLVEQDEVNESIKHLSGRTQEEIPNITYVVTAQAFDRITGKPLGESRDEKINPKTNSLFRNCYSILDVHNAYEAFWNNMNQYSDLVFVSKIRQIEE